MVADKEAKQPAKEFVPTGIYLPNQSPNIGVDSILVGFPQAAQGPKRYIHAKGHLLGVIHDLKPSDPNGPEKGLTKLEPVFGPEREPLPSEERLMPREGYAVSGIEVSVKTTIHAFRLHYRKIKPDLTLDARDVYSSPWVGTRLPGAQTARVDAPGEDRRIIGMTTYHSRGLVSAVSLVVDRR
jgi:hypothetical protein